MAKSETMSIRFGVSPIAWINDDMPELGGSTPLAQVLTDVRDLGFAGVELGGKFPREPAALASLLASYGIRLVGGWYSCSLLTSDVGSECVKLKRHLELLKHMGCQVFICAETSNAIHGDRKRPLSGTPRLEDSQWRNFGARLTELADYIAGHDMKLAYHHHLGTVVERQDDLDNFLRHTGPNVGLTLDTGHAALGGIDAVTVIREHPSRIVHVHCKDVRRLIFRQTLQQQRSFLDGVVAGMFTAPGDGDLDFAAVMHALVRIDYRGWVIVEAEQDPAVADPRVFSEIGLRTLKRDASAAGLVWNAEERR
jgi:inosose dehydratase